MEGLANQMQEMANAMRAMGIAQQQTQEMCQKFDERQMAGAGHGTGNLTASN